MINHGSPFTAAEGMEWGYTVIKGEMKGNRLSHTHLFRGLGGGAVLARRSGRSGHSRSHSGTQSTMCGESVRGVRQRKGIQ